MNTRIVQCSLLAVVAVFLHTLVWGATINSGLALFTALAVGAFFAPTTAAFASPATGDQTRWALDFRVRLEQPSGPPVEIHLVGQWISTIAAVRPGDFDAQLQLDDVRFTGAGVGAVSAAELEDLRTRLTRPFWATYRVDGGLVAVHFFRDANPADQNLLQMIATDMQLVRSASSVSWTARERDGAGEYMALYVATQPHRILKRKLKYLHTDGVSGAPANSMRVGIDHSEITYSFSADGLGTAVDAVTRMRLELSPDANSHLAVVTELHASNAHRRRAPELIGSLARHGSRVIRSAIVTHTPDPAEVRAHADDQLLNGWTTEALLAAGFAPEAPDSLLGDRLAAVFRRRPEAVKQAIFLLHRNGAQKRVTSALGRSGSPDAIAALATLARDAALPEDLRVDALTATVQITEPTAKTLEIPKALLQDANPQIRSAARMMAGALSRAARAAHPAEAERVDASLIVLYRASRDTEARIELLAALGNSVGPSVAPVLAEALADPHPAIRAAAVRSLRLAPGDETDDMIAAVITADADPTVRSDGIFAARFRRPLPPAITSALLRAATSDEADHVRSAAVALLRDNIDASPGVAETLARVAQKDPNAGIRRQARQALAAATARKGG